METYKSMFMKLDTGSHPLDHDLKFNSVSSDFRDLDLFVNWVESENLDYIDIRS